MTKQSLYDGKIFKKYLLNAQFLETEYGRHLINEHMLHGWLSHLEVSLDEKTKANAKKVFNRQWHLNQYYYDLIEKIAPDLEKANLNPVLLKGITLIESIYSEFGERSMSDIDILIPKEEIKQIEEILLNHGFITRVDSKWRANLHKIELVRNSDGIEVVVELHTSLLYHLPDPAWKLRPFKVAPYKQLAPDDLFLYLCSHLAFQHTFLKIFWMLDLHLFLSLDQKLDEELILEKAKRLQIYNSTVLCLFILDEYFQSPLGETFKHAIDNIPKWKKKVLDIDFILDPKRNYIKYLLVKSMCRDQIKESVNYGLGWIKDRFF